MSSFSKLTTLLLVATLLVFCASSAYLFYMVYVIIPQEEALKAQALHQKGQYSAGMDWDAWMVELVLLGIYCIMSVFALIFTFTCSKSGKVIGSIILLCMCAMYIVFSGCLAMSDKLDRQIQSQNLRERVAQMKQYEAAEEKRKSLPVEVHNNDMAPILSQVMMAAPPSPPSQEARVDDAAANNAQDSSGSCSGSGGEGLTMRWIVKEVISSVQSLMALLLAPEDPDFLLPATALAEPMLIHVRSPLMLYLHILGLFVSVLAMKSGVDEERIQEMQAKNISASNSNSASTAVKDDGTTKKEAGNRNTATSPPAAEKASSPSRRPRAKKEQ